MMSETPELNIFNFLEPSNREAVLQNRNRIRKQISRCIADQGFKRKGRSTFFTVLEELVAFAVIEHPSCMFYTWFCVYPLYMPPKGEGVLIYGLRLSELLSESDMNMNIRDYANSAETDLWCSRTSSFIQDAFLPFAAHVSTAQKMISCLEENAPHPRSDLYRVLNANRAKIGMYAWLSRHAYDRAAACAQEYLAKAEAEQTREDLKARYAAKAQEVLTLCDERNDSAVDALLAQWKAQNIALFAEKKRMPVAKGGSGTP